MTDTTADTTSPETEGDEAQTDSKTAGKTFTQADLDRIVADRVARERARYSDYSDLKKRAAAAMTEQERAVAEAEQRGRSAALKDSGSRLARAEFRAAAAGKVSTSALDGFLEYADLGRFVGDDGEPDEKAIAAAVKKLSGSSPGTNYDGGARGEADKPISMSALIRRHAGLSN